MPTLTPKKASINRFGSVTVTHVKPTWAKPSKKEKTEMPRILETTKGRSSVRVGLADGETWESTFDFLSDSPNTRWVQFEQNEFLPESAPIGSITATFHKEALRRGLVVSVQRVPLTNDDGIVYRRNDEGILITRKVETTNKAGIVKVTENNVPVLRGDVLNVTLARDLTELPSNYQKLVKKGYSADLVNDGELPDIYTMSDSDAESFLQEISDSESE